MTFMRPATLVFVGLGLSMACAGTKVAAAACEPVPAEFVANGPVHRECAVDKPARAPATFPPLQALNSSTPPSRPGGCSRVVIDMVIDTTGAPVTSTAKVVESNDPRFQEAIVSSLGSLRYTPAVKDNEKVAQLVRYTRTIQYMVVIQGSGSMPSVRSKATAPKC